MLWNQKVSNEQRAIEQLIARAHKGADEARWAIDLTSPMALMLITVLLGAEQSVVYVPGHVVNTMTGAFRGEGKTDAKDARVIAETARMRSDLSEVAMPDELVVELAQLTGYRTDVMADWVRGVNRLRSLLGSIFPGLEAAFDYSNRTPLILVAHLCTPAEIRAAGIKGVTAYLGDNGGWPTAIAKTAATAVAAAKQQPLALWPAAHSPADVLPQALLLVALFAVTVAAVVRRQPLGFAGAWFFLTLGPTSSLLPIPTEIAAEHRMYVPLAAVVAVVVDRPVRAVVGRGAGTSRAPPAVSRRSACSRRSCCSSGLRR